MEEIKHEQASHRKLLHQLLKKRECDVETMSFDFLPLQTMDSLLEFERKLAEMSFSKKFVSS